MRDLSFRTSPRRSDMRQKSPNHAWPWPPGLLLPCGFGSRKLQTDPDVFSPLEQAKRQLSTDRHMPCPNGFTMNLQRRLEMQSYKKGCRTWHGGTATI